MNEKEPTELDQMAEMLTSTAYRQGRRVRFTLPPLGGGVAEVAFEGEQRGRIISVDGDLGMVRVIPDGRSFALYLKFDEVSFE